MGLAKGKYGYFDEKNHEYVITRPDTPQPWYNYLVNDLGYVALISHTGGGTSFFQSARDKKILRYRYNSVPADRPGRWLYLRDMTSGDYWSSTWNPVPKPASEYTFRCHVGLNTQTVMSTYAEIASRLTYFVLPRRPAEVWLARLTNTGDRKRIIHSYSYGEFNFWGTLRDLLNLDNCPKCSRYHLDGDTIVHDTYNDLGDNLDNMQWVRHFAGFRSSHKPYAINPERQEFLGDIWRSESNPLVVESGRDSNFEGSGDYPICGLTHRWELQPGSSVEFAFVLAFGNNEDEMRRGLEAAGNIEELRESLEQVKERWSERLSFFQTATPEKEDFDPCVNTWNQYNAYINGLLSRSISPYNWGADRGLGFRDTLQDLMGVCHSEPEFARQRFLMMAGLIHSDGIAAHNYFPLTDTPDMRDFFDDHLWLPFTVARYLKETGEMGLLEERVRFVDGSGSQKLIDRLELVLDTTWRLRGKHGLPQTGHADWNDGLNPGSMESESLFNAMLFCASARELAAIAEFTGRNELAARCRERYEEMKELANTHGWDGQWYRRILLADGGCIGGKDVSPGSIFLEPQVWAVIGGVAEGERARTVMDSVYKHLARKHGIKLLDPPYTDYDPKWGSISILLPGHKENGAVFCHAASWAVVAEAILGNGSRAWDYYKRMAPTTNSRIAEVHETEPYVYSQHIAQEPFHKIGRARNSWLTGSATWFTLAGQQYILGVRPELGGLFIDPTIPGWKEFRVTRKFRGATYEIEVTNPGGVERGVKSVTVDGKAIEGNLVPPARAGATVKVEVVMG